MPQSHPPGVPHLRTIEKDGVRRTTWAEALNDLIFSVIIAQLARRLLKAPDAVSFFQFLLLYIPVWWLWTGETQYSTRFDTDRDGVHRLLSCLQLLVLLVLAATIPSVLEANLSSVLYALSYVTLRLILLTEYGRAGAYVASARPYIRHIGTGFLVSVLLWGVSTLVAPPYRYGFWAVALGIELSTPVATTGRQLHRQFPPDARHLPERYGLFTLIVLGQAVSNAAQGLIQDGFLLSSVLATLLGGITIIGMWWAYFDRLDDDAVQQAGRGGSEYPYLFWLYLHLPLTIALTVVGVGLTLAINAVNDPVLPSVVQWLLVGSVAGYFLAAGGISLTTLLAGPRHASFVWGLVVRLGLAAVLLGIRMSMSLSTLELLSVIAALVVCLIVADYFGPDAPTSSERSAEVGV